MAQCPTNVLWIPERRDGWQSYSFLLRQNIRVFKINLNFKFRLFTSTWPRFYFMSHFTFAVFWNPSFRTQVVNLWNRKYAAEILSFKPQIYKIQWLFFLETQRVCLIIFIPQIPNFREMLYYVALCTIPHTQAYTSLTSIDINIDI